MGGSHATVLGSEEYMLISKFNQVGQLQWAYLAGEAGTQGEGVKVVESRTGDYFALMANTVSFALVMELVKFTPQRDILWAVRVGGSSDDTP